jgi:hypothetical protein
MFRKYLLSSRELVSSFMKSFKGSWNKLFFGSDGEQDLSNLDSGRFTKGFTIGSSHTRLKSIGSGAWKHFINTENMPGMHSASEMEVIFTGFFNHGFVSGNTGGFESFRSKLFSKIYLKWIYKSILWYIVS